MSNKSSYDFWSSRSTEEIVNSLKDGEKEPLIVNSSGKIMQGNTRAKILQERGYNIDSLPRVPHP